MKTVKWLIVGFLVGAFLGTGFSTALAQPVGPPGTQPIDADKVDGFDAFASPVADSLLALNSDAKFPLSALPQGPGSGLDADTVDGLHSSDFSLASHDHDDAYVNEGQVASITGDMLVGGSITGEKLAAGTVSADRIADITRTITANLMGHHSEFPIGSGGSFGVRMLSSSTTSVLYSFAIPRDYAGGSLTVSEWYRAHDAAGLAEITRSTAKVTNAGDTIGLEGATAFDIESTASSQFLFRTWTIPDAWILPGELVWVQLERSGDLAADTMGRLDLMAVGIDYPAEQ